jgi:peptidoglycan/LPS O-acetylase OafA/YrhL
VKLVSRHTVAVEDRSTLAGWRASRLPGLDGLRGIAAMAVVLFHFTAWDPFLRTGQYGGPGLLFWFPYGCLGVELFFIISGFVIFMTLERTTSFVAFAAARFARLYPAFLACMLTSLALILLFRWGQVPIDARLIVANLTMIPQSFGALYIDGSYWSLRFELEFYLLAGLTCLVLRCRAPEVPCAIWLAGELLLRGWVGMMPMNIVMKATHTSFAHLFVIGIMLYRLRAGQATKLTLPLLLLAISIGFFGRYWSEAPISGAAYGAVTAGFAALVWIATTSYGRFLSIAPLRFLGRISYPLYLIHGAAGSELVARLLTAGWNPNVAVLVTIASAIGLAWAISTFVEWPAQRWLRTRFAAWANRARRSLNEVLSPGGPHCHCERSEAIPGKERNAKGIAAALRSPQ